MWKYRLYTLNKSNWIPIHQFSFHPISNLDYFCIQFTDEWEISARPHMQKIPCLRSGGDTVQKHPQEVTCEYDPYVSLKLE